MKKDPIKIAKETSGINPSMYAVTSNAQFIKESPEKAIKSIKTELRQFDDKGAITVYVGYNYNDQELFCLIASRTNIIRYAEN